MSGVLYGLGVGPGDPELITVKALRLLRACPVLAYPAPQGGDSLVRRLVDGHLDGAKVELRIDVPMAVERFPAQNVYDQAAEEISAHLDAGRDVAAICEGDPFFYGSFLYLHGRLAERHRVEIVPGVSSLTACAAALGMPLSARNDVLSVIPATLPDEALADRLGGCDSAAIIKLGRHFERVRGVLRELGLSESARFIAHATMEHQTIRPLDAVLAEDVPYFSMILLHKRGEAWR